MSYDEEQQRRSRVVIETPTERREVVQHQTVRSPERERSGFSSGMLAAVALTAIAATAIVFLFLMNRGDDSIDVSVNARVASQPTPYVQQPPVMVQPTPLQSVVTVPAPATAATPITVIVQQAPPATTTAPPQTSAPPASSGTDDASVQARIDKAITDDRALFDAGITATIIGGKVTINGTVKTEALKERAERVAYSVKGVQSVDNRITVIP